MGNGQCDTLCMACPNVYTSCVTPWFSVPSLLCLKGMSFFAFVCSFTLSTLCRGPMSTSQCPHVDGPPLKAMTTHHHQLHHTIAAAAGASSLPMSALQPHFGSAT